MMRFSTSMSYSGGISPRSRSLRNLMNSTISEKETECIFRRKTVWQCGKQEDAGGSIHRTFN